MSKLYKAVNEQRLERWLGVERINHLRQCMKDWYAERIYIIDLPGNVWIDRDGNFSGEFHHGYFASAMDHLHDYIKRFWTEAGKPQYASFNVGFASVSDALSRASSGYAQERVFTKSGPTGVVAASSTLWRVGAQPIGGGTSGAAPDGTAHTSANTGALSFNNPASGTLHLTGADVSASVINNTLLVYDRLFSVAKTMNSTATQAVTGVPTRYQSTVATNEDYAGGNFLFIEVGGTALSATAHNWTTCTYVDQAGVTGITLPSVTGNSSAIVDRFDMPTSTWFCPLASGDTGIQSLTQMQCSAAVATGVINFCIGHPLGFMSFPVINSFMPFDWLTNKKQTPRIFDNACISFIEPLKPATGATTYTGVIQVTNAA